jgi:sugar phosphate isomerase/epimerase
MRLAFIGDNDLPSIERDATFAEQHGFSGIEFNYWHGLNLPPDTISRMRQILDNHHVQTSMLGVWGLNPLSSNTEEREKALGYLNQALDAAHQLGATTLVASTGDIPGASVGQKVTEFQKTFSPIFEKSQKIGINICFYALHSGSFLNNLQTCERVWDVLPEMKLKFDPANWQQAGQDYLDVIHQYGEKIGYIHIKEHLNHNGQLLSQPAAGMGDITWGKVFALLYEHNYDGWLSVEPHGPLWGKPPLREKMLILSKRYISQFLV